MSRCRTAQKGALIAGLMWAAACVPGTVPEQPIPFNHKLHLTVEVDGVRLECKDCHPGVLRGEHASLPPLRACLRCHMRPQSGDKAEPSQAEKRVRELAAGGGEFRWVQVTRNPGHVYAPHRVHVGLAKMACENCHGDVREWSAPPTIPNPLLTSMSRCLECHRERGAATQCSACHR